jgi:hypothetical protein
MATVLATLEPAGLQKCCQAGRTRVSALGQHFKSHRRLFAPVAGKENLPGNVSKSPTPQKFSQFLETNGLLALLENTGGPCWIHSDPEGPSKPPQIRQAGEEAMTCSPPAFRRRLQ